MNSVTALLESLDLHVIFNERDGWSPPPPPPPPRSATVYIYIMNVCMHVDVFIILEYKSKDICSWIYFDHQQGKARADLGGLKHPLQNFTMSKLGSFYKL